MLIASGQCVNRFPIIIASWHLQRPVWCWVILATLGRFYAPTLQRAVLFDRHMNEQRLQRIDNLRDTGGSIIVKPHDILKNWKRAERLQAAFVVIFVYCIIRHQVSRDYIQGCESRFRVKFKFHSFHSAPDSLQR